MSSVFEVRRGTEECMVTSFFPTHVSLSLLSSESDGARFSVRSVSIWRLLSGDFFLSLETVHFFLVFLLSVLLLSENQEC